MRKPILDVFDVKCVVVCNRSKGTYQGSVRVYNKQGRMVWRVKSAQEQGTRLRASHDAWSLYHHLKQLKSVSF